MTQQYDNETVVINFFGGAGVGKSTNTARLFALMKDAGYEVEIVTEFAKDLVWEDHLNVLDDQFFVSATQNHRLFKLKGRVKFIITDSPLLLGSVYTEDKLLKSLIESTFNSYDNFNVLLKRVKEYKPNGRLQTEEEAVLVDKFIRDVLNEGDHEYCEITGDESGVLDLFKTIKDKYKQ